MKRLLLLSALAGWLCIGNAADNIDTRKLTLVEENHANLTIESVAYTLDSYVIPFEQPYYVKVRRNDSKPMTLEEAARVAEQYILPRGCTDPLSRRKDLDKSNTDRSQWLVGILC